MIIIDKLRTDGFATKSGLAGDIMTIETKNTLSSNDKLFFDRIENISNLLPIINMNHISSFLVIINKDYQARLYVNEEITLIMGIKPKRNIQKGEGIIKEDILDITTISFKDIEITQEDRIIYCQKVERKFFLYYDLGRYSEKLNVEKMYQELGAAYRSLFFEKIYVLLNQDKINEAMKHGRFPFIGLIDQYKSILEYFNEKEERRNIFILKFIDNYDNKIEDICNKRRSKDIFSQKKEIIESGLKNYQQNNQGGFISCIKTLSSEIEGIIRISYYQEKNFSKNSQKQSLNEYINNIIKHGKEKETTLFFPELFLNFLNNVFFENGYLEEDFKDAPTTRHTVNHGILQPKGYSKENAFQLIMILDQIYFYLP